MTRPHPADIAAVCAANRDKLMSIIAVVQQAAAPIDLNAKPERKP